MSKGKAKKAYPIEQGLFSGEPFKPMRYGAANNALAHVPAKKSRYEIDKLANTMTYARGKLTVKIDGTDSPLPASASRLLDFLYLEHTRQNSNSNGTEIAFSFDDYADYRGVTDKQARMRLRKQLQDDIDKLYRLSFEWSDPEKNDSIKTRLIGSTEVFESRNSVKVSLVPGFAKYINGHYLMPFDTRLGKLDRRNPHTYKIGRKMIEHYRILPNQERGIHDRLSVQSLLEADPDIPTIEEVNKKDRAFYKHILMPLETSMNALVKANILEEWTWWKAANVPLTDAELERADWATLRNCMVHFRLCEPQAGA